MKVVILDPGHGGVKDNFYQTAGKRSPIWEDGSQYFEGEGNRIIAKIATQYLEKLGWTVLFTVNPDNPEDVYLGKRIAISNNHYKTHKKAFQISIHSNAYKKNIGKGSEVFVDKNASKKSQKLAELWRDEHIKAFPKITWRGVKMANLAMNKVNCPSILIETMFHSYEEECRVLMSSKGKEQIAIAIAEACELFNSAH